MGGREGCRMLGCNGMLHDCLIHPAPGNVYAAQMGKAQMRTAINAAPRRRRGREQSMSLSPVWCDRAARGCSFMRACGRVLVGTMYRLMPEDEGWRQPTSGTG